MDPIIEAARKAIGRTITSVSEHLDKTGGIPFRLSLLLDDGSRLEIEAINDSENDKPRIDVSILRPVRGPS